MKIIIKILIIAFITITMIQAAGSRINGKVTDAKSGKSLIGANVFLTLDDGTTTTFGSATDIDGSYLISQIPIGSYLLVVYYIGYESHEEFIRTRADGEYKIDIALSPSAIQLQETKVTGQKRQQKVTEAPASVEIVSSRDIKRQSTTNIGSYLKGLKGVDFTSSGINNYSINIRGFNSSFSTRLLTLTDGRVANIPALRVINYSTIPQSTDDIEKMEVVLGPTTALYGANAHSGVVNIISKSPADSEGLTMSISGTADDRELRKINTRYAKKLTDMLSMKVSGSYLHAFEWPYVSDLEHKTHSYPWTGNPYRINDGKDNNPWTSPNIYETEGDQYISEITELDNWVCNDDGDCLLIGDGEPNHGDLDGDGFAGEDWFNGYDDDGDGEVDEDYFYADGIDNFEPFIDSNADGNIDGQWDEGEDYEDWNLNGEYDGINDDTDEGIDGAADQWYDGYDNNENGVIDDSVELDPGRDDAYSSDWSYDLDERNIIINGGRKYAVVNGKSNPWYIEDCEDCDVRGEYFFDEETVKFLFDVYIYDFGEDGIPGDPWIDGQGDGEFQLGEHLRTYTTDDGGSWDYSHGNLCDECDCGLDGVCPGDNGYLGPDFGEGDGIWQPGDGWIDTNNNDIPEVGIDYYNTEVDITTFMNDGDGDVWPPPNGIWDEGEIINDWGQDGIPGTQDYGEDSLFVAMDGFNGEPFDDLNDNGIFDILTENYYDVNNNGEYDFPNGEFDGILDTGDGIYGGDGDYIDNFQRVNDVNGDGLSDYPDFEVDNRKVEFRMDLDLSSDINISFQTGYSSTKTQQVTGTGRYIADGFEYTYYQLRGRYKNWFAQTYLNQSNSGDTRGYNLGNRINDVSRNMASQLQHNIKFDQYRTHFVWGIDYFRTEPETNGTILNDGPNGYDNNGNNLYLSNDGIDNDGDGLTDELTCDDGSTSGFKDGKIWLCGEGIDEEDEFEYTISNELGVYFQTKTNIWDNDVLQLITAARLDYNDVLSEGLQFGPKLGLIYKPTEMSTFRLTYGKAFNTPTSIALHTDLFIRKFSIMDVYLRGNKDGTPYKRVEEDYSVWEPGFYFDDGFHSITPEGVGEYYFKGNPLSGLPSYSERIQGAPYFFNLTDPNIPVDMIPLDTARYVIFVPVLNGDGVLYSPEETYNIKDVEPLKTEKIQSYEIGYKGFISQRFFINIDIYYNKYNDFFSPPTVITPLVVRRQFDEYGNDITTIDNFEFAGIMTVNDNYSNPPYGTSWNSKDDDGDWTDWADEFGWWDDDDGDGNPIDHGEWGYVDEFGNVFDPNIITLINDGAVSFRNVENFYPECGDESIEIDCDYSHWTAVGVDEYAPQTGLSEYEPIQSYFRNTEGEFVTIDGRAMAPPHIVLSPMNYGNVEMQGLDFDVTYLLPEYNLYLSANFSFYGTTDFFNELTRQNDPINAPKFKWNASAKWDTDYGDLMMAFRHVDQFLWSDGIWSGIIGPYNLIDIHYNYKFTEQLGMSISAMNIMNDIHRELVGGAKMGRQIVLRFSSNF